MQNYAKRGYKMTLPVSDNTIKEALQTTYYCPRLRALHDCPIYNNVEGIVRELKRLRKKIKQFEKNKAY
jgi:hypothetical protein